MKLSERLFAGTSAESELEDALSDTGLEFERLGWDDYDNSLEIYGVPSACRLSDAARKIIQEAGFAVCYLNHVDKWETHYRMNSDKSGWRVSYPSKRNDGDPSIWLESRVADWPDSFLVTIKNGK